MPPPGTASTTQPLKVSGLTEEQRQKVMGLTEVTLLMGSLLEEILILPVLQETFRLRRGAATEQV